MTNKEYSKITACKNWCDFDQLDGITIKNGESLEVIFPDGVAREIAACVVNDSYSASDMGHQVSIPTAKAYALTEAFGAKTKVELIGLLARRVTK